MVLIESSLDNFFRLFDNMFTDIVALEVHAVKGALEDGICVRCVGCIITPEEYAFFGTKELVHNI